MPTGADLVQLLILFAALLVAGALLAVAVRTRRRGDGTPVAEPAAGVAAEAAPPLPAVIVNPTKIADMDGERAWLARECSEQGWQRPLWFETTPEDPGSAVARQAVAQGARTVIAYGGDGTVRAVAAGLEGSEAVLGILPMGTGNLLARNLGIPVSDHQRAVEVALTGRERQVDIGLIEIDVSGEDQDPARETFLVMAGLGFDAEVMANVEPALKQKVGWWAYVVTGARRLRGRTTAVTLHLDDGEPIRTKVRSVIIGNCGELTGGLALLPEARVDDGLLDVVVIAPRRIAHWGTVVITVLSRARLARFWRPTERPVMQRFRCRTIEIRAEKPMAVQLDGDPARDARVLRAAIDPLGLTVRTPRS